ncbi:dCMP deaminase family protein [Candidatus Woesearchaeota archaeon]|nr:dCMP deaminase family protein [Candidatus Woesearchaeota archaeon]
MEIIRKEACVKEHLSENKTKKLVRPTWDEYFIKIAKLVATRSNCLRRQVGAVLVRDKMIISTGYNGTPRGTTNCDEGGCRRCANPDVPSGSGLGECTCVHAEENAILQAAYNGMPVKGSTLYTSLCPCIYCAKHLINAGVVKVFYSGSYAMDDQSKSILREAGVELFEYKDRDV